MICKKFNHEITWGQFEACNSNPCEAFEKLCRWLFNDFFFQGRALLHSEPNNPGIEVLPVFHAESQKIISFQSKYFTSMDYEQIKESAKKAVKYYTGKLDIIYLYCNKDVTVTSKRYQAIIEILKPSGIELVPITNQQILEQVMKNETMCWYFFDQFILTPQWIEKQLNTSLTSLGPRYNRSFNVTTSTEELFDIFLCAEEAANKVNRNKEELFDTLIKRRNKYQFCKKEYREMVAVISELQELTSETLLNCLEWEEILLDKCSAIFSVLKNLLKNKEEELSIVDIEKDKEKYFSIIETIENLEFLLNVPQMIMPSDFAKRLMQNQILIVKGIAGSGKSQMLAVAAEKCFAEDAA